MTLLKIVFDLSLVSILIFMTVDIIINKRLLEKIKVLNFSDLSVGDYFIFLNSFANNSAIKKSINIPINNIDWNKNVIPDTIHYQDLYGNRIPDKDIYLEVLEKNPLIYDINIIRQIIKNDKDNSYNIYFTGINNKSTEIYTYKYDVHISSKHINNNMFRPTNSDIQKFFKYIKKNNLKNYIMTPMNLKLYESNYITKLRHNVKTVVDAICEKTSNAEELFNELDILDKYETIRIIFDIDNYGEKDISTFFMQDKFKNLLNNYSTILD